MSIFRKQDRLDNALFRAMKNGYGGDVRKLVEKGADVNRVFDHGILFCELEYPYASTVEFLIDKGVDPKGKDADGKSVIMHAVNWERPDIALLLLEYTNEIDELDKVGNSLIMLAVILNQYHLVKELLKQGADLSIKNDKGEDIFSLSINERMDRILEPYDETKAKVSIQTSNQGWHIISDDEIAYIQILEPLSREITDIFNFKSERHIKIIRNLKTDAESHSQCDMFVGNDNDQEKKAAFQLYENGSNIDLEAIKNRSYKMIDGKATSKVAVPILK